MSTGGKRDGRERSATDASVRSQRQQTDEALVRRSEAQSDEATGVVAEARHKADSVLSVARDREDLAMTAHHDTEDLTQERAEADQVLEWARSGADAVVRDEAELRQVSLAKLLAFERDFSDLRLELERARADRALTSREDFLAMVSHDLRSLLGGIALSAELLAEVGTYPDPLVKVADYAARIMRFSARMNRLIGDLMDVASIEAGKLSLVRVRRRATLLLRDALEAFAPVAAAQDITLRCECGMDPGVVELDHERLLQVLTNLVGNALKFTPKGGAIVIRLERRQGDVCFSVTDSGEGVSLELRDRIFERYYQSRAADRRGLGLGLFISRSIIEAHGGRIWIEGEPGQGASFLFAVPMVPVVAPLAPINAAA